ncbi:hypothetical protein OS493_006441 [Desmophyllum pertusum]|uniref:Uncharacterized protein n=1 Tax=Desmophyllum pertusum TaxID=174260 RepID=A0A9X0DAK4_9CNID|nr:hypothetical protein OS493_006441 [Desmophyllum pertusum]
MQKENVRKALTYLEKELARICVTLADSTAEALVSPDLEIAAEMGRLAIRNELPALPNNKRLDCWCIR